MKAKIGHIGINLSSSKESLSFWKELCSFLGFKIIEDGDHFDAGDGQSYFCVSVADSAYKERTFPRKSVGLNHIAFKVDTPQMVDNFVCDFLGPRKIEPLYGGAKEYPQYAEGYYAVFFEDPDRIKIEVVCEPSN